MLSIRAWKFPGNDPRNAGICQRRLYNSARKPIHINCEFELGYVIRLLSAHISSFEQNFSFASCKNLNILRLFGPKFIVLEELAGQDTNFKLESTETMDLNLWKVMRVTERMKFTFHASFSLPDSASNDFLRSVRSEAKSKRLPVYVCDGAVRRRISSGWADIVKAESFLSFGDRVNYRSLNIYYNGTVSSIYRVCKKTADFEWTIIFI